MLPTRDMRARPRTRQEMRRLSDTKCLLSEHGNEGPPDLRARVGFISFARACLSHSGAPLLSSTRSQLLCTFLMYLLHLSASNRRRLFQAAAVHRTFRGRHSAVSTVNEFCLEQALSAGRNGCKDLRENGKQTCTRWKLSLKLHRTALGWLDSSTEDPSPGTNLQAWGHGIRAR